MATVSNPETFSMYFNVDPMLMEEIGVLDPTLAVDTKLFIDPLLLPYSTHPEIHGKAYDEYKVRFERVIALLSASKVRGDVAWRAARKHLVFHEIKGTCLGYGAGSIRGSGFGPQLTERILEVGKEIADLGINDPDLFPALALFEADIGPDRISDMTTNVICSALIPFNRRVLEQLNLLQESEEFIIAGRAGRFLSNPFESGTPIILVPTDILRVLPIAKDWDEIADAASQSQALRDRVNEQIGHIFAKKRERDRGRLRKEVLSSATAFETLLDAIHAVLPRPYQVGRDPDGRVHWANLGKKYSDKYPLDLTNIEADTPLDRAHKIVRLIIDQFQFLIENRGLWKELYDLDGKPRHESSVQNIFFIVAYCYCKANNLDISPETDTGTGRIDFKFSAGFHVRVLVEIKLSTNTHCVNGYENQLNIYRESEETMRAWYVVVDVGKMGRKQERLFEIRNRRRAEENPISELEFVDGLPKDSASRA